MPKKSLKF